MSVEFQKTSRHVAIDAPRVAEVVSGTRRGAIEFVGRSAQIETPARTGLIATALARAANLLVVPPVSQHAVAAVVLAFVGEIARAFFRAVYFSGAEVVAVSAFTALLAIVRGLSISFTGAASVVASYVRHRGVVAASAGVASFTALLAILRALGFSAVGTASVVVVGYRIRYLPAISTGLAVFSSFTGRIRTLMLTAAVASTLAVGLRRQLPVGDAISAGVSAAEISLPDSVILLTDENGVVITDEFGVGITIEYS
jgi:hypothetical protein